MNSPLKSETRFRLAAFGFRSVPPKPGCAGADKFAEELYSRLASRGYEVTAYNRVYSRPAESEYVYRGVRMVNLRTFKQGGLEALYHSLKATAHIVLHNTGEVVHIQNGGNSIFAVLLRLFGKRVFITEDGAEWSRGKWRWYGRLFLQLSTSLTAYVPNGVIFDNHFVRDWFEDRFHRQYHFVPYGSDPVDGEEPSDILERLGLKFGEYFLFVGRFIPDKGLHHLIPAFERVQTKKKLVLVGGALGGSEYESALKATTDNRVLFPGFLYGPDVHALMRGAYAYIQPSDIEGLSPVILENMGLGTPVICSDLSENLYVVGDTALTFRKGEVDDLAKTIRRALDERPLMESNAVKARRRSIELFSWDAVVTQHEAILFGDGDTGVSA